MPRKTMPNDVRRRLRHIMAESMRGHSLNADDQKFCHETYKAYPAEYGRLHAVVKAEAAAELNPLHPRNQRES